MYQQKHRQRWIMLKIQATLVSESLKVGLEAEEELEAGFRNGDTTKAFRWKYENKEREREKE